MEVHNAHQRTKDLCVFQCLQNLIGIWTHTSNPRNTQQFNWKQNYSNLAGYYERLVSENWSIKIKQQEQLGYYNTQTMQGIQGSNYMKVHGISELNDQSQTRSCAFHTTPSHEQDVENFCNLVYVKCWSRFIYFPRHQQCSIKSPVQSNLKKVMEQK